MNRILFAACALLFVSACAKRQPRPEKVREADREKIEETLADEVSLKADRSELDQARKDIPEETKKVNDELALQLNLMKQGTESPVAFRDKFQSLMTKKRADFRKKVERLREDYRQEETRRREDFTQAQRRKRESYMSSKRDSQAVRRFTQDQERDRTRFFADETDRRKNFETELNSRSKDFDSYMRERNNEFNEQYRLYSKKFYEKPKEKKAVTGDEFRNMDQMPTTPLNTEE